MEPKTRLELIQDANRRIWAGINALARLISEHEIDEARGTADYLSRRETVEEECTVAGEWYELSEILVEPRAKAQAFKIAQAVLVRNGYRDGLPFCPLCGKIGYPDHNGAPVINEQVCEACNQRRIIPARIREAQREEE